MHLITRSLALMALATLAVPYCAAAQDTTGIGPNASEPGSASPTPITPAPTPAPAPEVTPAPAPANVDTSTPGQKPAPIHFKIGVDYTLYLPTDEHTRDRFGSSWSSISLGLGGVGETGKRAHFATEMNLIYQSKGDNHVFLAPIGLTYRIHQGPQGGVRPYTGASLGVLVVSLHSAQDNVSSGLTSGVYGSLYAGVTFKDNYFVEARYYAASKVSSFDLSGTDISAGIRF